MIDAADSQSVICKCCSEWDSVRKPWPLAANVCMVKTCEGTVHVLMNRVDMFVQRGVPFMMAEEPSPISLILLVI